jgi:hypothetical protein
MIKRTKNHDIRNAEPTMDDDAAGCAPITWSIDQSMAPGSGSPAAASRKVSSSSAASVDPASCRPAARLRLALHAGASVDHISSRRGHCNTMFLQK